MPNSMDANMQSLLDGDNVFRFSRCWRITRTDGTTFDFTDCNVPLTVGGGVNVQFFPAGGIETSAMQQQLDMESGNAELRGIVSSDKITEDDLRGGKFRDATVTEYLVDWMHPHQGYFQRRTFLILSTTFGGEEWTAEMVEKTQLTEKPHGRVYSRNCGWKFRDTNCGHSSANDTDGSAAIVQSSKTISTVVDARKTFRISGISGTLHDNDFQYGSVSFTSGNAKLNGLVLEIGKYTASTKEFSLNLPAPFDLTTSTVVTVTQGCPKTKTACKNRFNNYVKFGGFPFIPGDQMVRINPDAPPA